MNTFYGVWDPESLVLPDVTDLDFGAYYILNTGTVEGTLYEKDKWLIYICKSRGKVGETSYWRITDGVVCFNAKSNTNTPDPGWYAKVRIDNNGNIVGTDYLSEDDMPEEVTNRLAEITDDKIYEIAMKAIANAFVTDTFNPIQFKFDEKSQKEVVSLKVDEETIAINEFGQLSFIGDSFESSGSSSGNQHGGNTTNNNSAINPKVLESITLHTSKIEALEKEVAILKTNVQKFRPIEGEGIRIDETAGGAIINTVVDGNSIMFNANGELCINPNSISDYLTGDGGDCANHGHSVEQIDGIDKYIKDILTNFEIKDSITKSLEDLVDQETIVVNGNGQLEAVATHVQAHKHVMNDITDLNQDIANVWATEQRMHGKYDFANGVFDMSTLTVGETFVTINQWLNKYQQQIAEIKNKLGKVEPVEPNTIEAADFVIDLSEETEVIDSTNGKIVKAIPKLIIETKDIIWQNGDIVSAYIDNIKVDSMDTFTNEEYKFDEGAIRGGFTATYVGEAYPRVKSYQGFYTGYSFKYESSNINEGPHNIRFKTVNVNDSSVHESLVYDFILYKNEAGQFRINPVFKADEHYCSGVKFLSKEPEISIQPFTEFNNRYYTTHHPVITDIFNNQYQCELAGITPGTANYKPVSIKTPKDFAGSVSVTSVSFDTNGEMFDGPYWDSPYFKVDNTSEKYRVRVNANSLADLNQDALFEDWDSSQSLNDHRIVEAQFVNDCAVISELNYTLSGIGPNYTNRGEAQRFTLRFPVKNCNNFYMDIVNSELKPLKTNKRKEFEQLQIYTKIVEDNIVNNWSNCNVPYIGHGNSDAVGFQALDLYRSNDTRRYFTFGQRPSKVSGNLFITFIMNGVSIHLPTLIKSLEESLHI